MVIKRILDQRGYVTLTTMKSAFLMKPEQSVVSLGKRYSEVTEHVMAFISLQPSTLREGILEPMRESTVSLKHPAYYHKTKVQQHAEHNCIQSISTADLGLCEGTRRDLFSRRLLP